MQREAPSGGIQPLVIPLQALAHRQLQPAIQPRQMLTLLGEAFAGMAQPRAQMIEPLGLGVEAPAPGLMKPSPLLIQRRLEIAAIRHQSFGGGGGRRGAHVGGELGQGHVDLVADGGHHRQLRMEDRPRQMLVVERPQVFQAAATAGDQDRIERICRRMFNVFMSLGILSRLTIDQGQRPDQRRRCLPALHRRREHADANHRPARPQHRQHIANRRAGRGGDQCQMPGRVGQRPGVGEYAFGVQLPLQSLVGRHQLAFAAGLDGIDDQLVIAPRLEDRHPPAHLDPVAILQRRAGKARPVAEERAPELRLGILQREVDVAGSGPRQSGNFPLDPAVAEAALQHLAGLAVEIADG